MHTDSNDDVAQEGKVDANVLALQGNPIMPEAFEDVKLENPNSSFCSIGDGVSSFSGVNMPGFKSDQLEDDDYLDHIILKERKRMLLLSRKYVGLKKSVLQDSSVALLENLAQEYAKKEKEENNIVNGEFSLSKDDDRIYSLERRDMELISCEPFSRSNINTSNGSSLSTIFKIKGEPSDDINFHKLDRDARNNFSMAFPVKSEPEISNEIDGDEVDHMNLGDRIKMLKSRDDSELNVPRDYECLKKFVPSVTDCSSIASECAKATSFGRPRKRKKTATDAIETALEEDAPGLLQALVDKGVSVDEIKLYGEMESDEAIDESSSEDSFTELQAVISKLFAQQRNAFLKFAPLHYAKGARANYCLACLFSLVEQTRYLQFRKWPVEWGWCRDLQSFIFVFERHNRLVLERPEYGYATYFFELVDSLPLDWQIKRLVIAMKLTSCSRISLIENRPLLIGEDLTEGEAKVLMEYGWEPNSGLGTMLKYCDRVVHDRKNEKEISEWRSRIGKLLMDGYNGGTIVLTDIPMKAMENRDAQGTQVKLEL